eukprot:1161174-Pelagomonas_calceolata.AAC.7
MCTAGAQPVKQLRLGSEKRHAPSRVCWITAPRCAANSLLDHCSEVCTGVFSAYGDLRAPGCKSAVLTSC